MGVANAIYEAVRKVQALVDVPVFLDWADAERSEAPYAVVDVEDTGSGDPPQLILLSTADVVVYGNNGVDAARMSAGIRTALDGGQFADPLDEVSIVRPVLSGETSGSDDMLEYSQTTWSIRSFKSIA